MTSIAVRRARAWAAFGAVLAIIAGVGLMTSPAFAAGPVYLVNDDVATSTSFPGPAGWNASDNNDEWDIQDDGLHVTVEASGADFVYVLDGQRYSSLEQIMSFLEGSGITVTHGELQWVCLGVEFTAPLLPSPSPSPSVFSSALPDPGSTVEVQICLGEDASIGVGTTSFTSVDTWGMCVASNIRASSVFDDFENCEPQYTLEELLGLLTSYSPAVGIHFLEFGTEAESGFVVTQAVLGTDFRFTAEPGPELAETGPTISAPVIGGALLLFLGLGAMAFVAVARPRRD